MLGRTAAGLLGALGLLFVPAGVGVVQQGGLLLRHGPALIVALLVSTVATLVVAATFAGIAMGLNAVVSSILVPMLLPWLL